jgi:hypothetical protein
MRDMVVFDPATKTLQGQNQISTHGGTSEAASEIEFDKNGPVVREQGFDHACMYVPADTRKKDEVDGPGRPGGRESAFLDGVETILAETLKMFVKRCRRISRLVGSVKVATHDGRDAPSFPAFLVYGGKKVDHVLKLGHAVPTRPIVEVHIHQGKNPSLNIELNKKKALLPHPLSAKNHSLGIYNGVLGQKGVAIAEIEQSLSLIVYTEDEMGDETMNAQVTKVVEVTSPARFAIDLLECDNIGAKLMNKGGDSTQVLSYAAGKSQPLDGIETPAVRDIKRDQAQPGRTHSTTLIEAARSATRSEPLLGSLKYRLQLD